MLMCLSSPGLWNLLLCSHEDRRNWTVKKFSSFAEADEAEDKYYASLSEVERLEILIGLRAQVVHKMKGIEKIVLKKTIHEPED